MSHGYRRMISLIPGKPPTPNAKLFELIEPQQQAKIKPKKLDLEELPTILNKQHFYLVSMIPNRLKTEVKRLLTNTHNKNIKSEDDRYDTIDFDRSKSRKTTQIRKISNTNSYQKQQLQNKLRQLKYSYDCRRRHSSLGKFNFEISYLNFLQITQEQQQQISNVNKLRIDKSYIINRLQQQYNKIITNKIINFFEIPKTIDFQFWKQLINKMHSLNQEQIMVIIFRFLNNCKYISSTDLFNLQIYQKSESISQDCQIIISYIQNNLNTQTIDNEELKYLQQSSIFDENLTISNLIQWTEIYQIDTSNIIKKPKQINIKRTVPIDQFISIHSNEEKEETIKKRNIEQKYPIKYQEFEPFSINFPIFRRIFCNKQLNFWKELIQLFCGQK